MNNGDPIELLNKINHQFGFSDKSIEIVCCYLNNLIHWNRKLNLVGHKSTKDLINRSVYDCFLVADYFLKNNLFKNKKALDFGSGAGLPGVILKIISDIESNQNNFEIHLVERRKKKSAFLNYLNLEMDLNLKVYWSSVEEMNVNSFDWIISRATLSSNQKIIDLVKKHLRRKGEIYLMKSEPEINQLNLKSLENIELIKTNQSQRYLIRIIP